MEPEDLVIVSVFENRALWEGGREREVSCLSSASTFSQLDLDCRRTSIHVQAKIAQAVIHSAGSGVTNPNGMCLRCGESEGLDKPQPVLGITPRMRHRGGSVITRH